ncbi:MAG TPA: cystathionine beta-lyase [Propionibacteriaceae bacterium]|nr:cystathionine beta-lyase [Propionibacteriaceae bacterium]
MPILSVPLSELRQRTSLKWRTFDEDVLPMWVAEMDVHLPPVVHQVLVDALDRGDTGYPHGSAYPEAFAAMAAQRWQLELDATSQVVRAGDVMSSVLALLEATTAPGDTVVINPPVYPPFRTVITSYGRKLQEVPLTTSGRLDLAALEASFEGSDRPKAYLLCSPHNPTGSVHTAAELTELMALANQAGVQVISDEIHARVVDADVPFVPVVAVPGGEHALTATSAGKAWNLAGFKAGLIIAGSAAVGRLAKLAPYALEAGGHLAELAHTAALQSAQQWMDELNEEIATNKRLFAAELQRRLPQLHYQPSPATYLAWLDCTPLGLSDPAAHFRRQGRVAFSAGARFASSHRNWVRVNLACSPDLVVEAVRRMAASV